MSGDWKKSLLGSFLYTFSSYRLINVMVRAAVGEYTTMAFFPLLVYGVWHIYRKEGGEQIRTADCMPVIIAATGILNSHILSCEMVLLFAILFGVFNYRKTFQKNILAALTKSAIYTILINMWFIIPFIQSMGMKTSIGKNTLTIFLLHGFLKRYLGSIDSIFIYSRNVNMTLAILLSIIVVLVFGNRYVGALGKLIFTGEGLSKIMAYVKARMAERLM